MTTNKPEVVAYLHTEKENPECRGVSLHHDASCTSTLVSTEPLIRLSEYKALQAKVDRLSVVQEEPVEFDYPDFHELGMGCGLEDRNITDRYEAMRYGWDKALDRVAEIIDGLGPLYTAQQSDDSAAVRLDKQCREAVASALGFIRGGDYAWSYLLQQIKDITSAPDVSTLDIVELCKLLLILRGNIGGAMWTLDDEEEELAVRTEKAIDALVTYSKQRGE